MKRTLCLLPLVLVCSVAVSTAQSMGTVTENGIAMDVKAAVGLLDSDGPTLVFFLLPFQPTAAEIGKLQADDYFWVLDKPSPDAKKWKTCPYGKFRLSWTSAKQSLGDATKATVYVQAQGVAAENSSTNINKLPGEVTALLAGAVKDGQEVTLTSKGADTLGKTTMAWDLKLKARVLVLKKS